MSDDGTVSGTPTQGGVATYVSLFLLLFVFFIVLVSISEVQRPRARVVIQSVDAAFGHLPSSLGLIDPPKPELRPETHDVEGFAREVTGLLTGFSPLARSATAAPNDSFLEVALPEDSVFAQGSADPKAAVLPTLDRLALLLQHRAAGHGVRVTWRTILPADVPAGGTVEERAVSRAAAIAARLTAEGCPSEALAVSIEHGSEASLRLDFAIIADEPPEVVTRP